MEWATFGAIGAIIISAASFASTILGKSLSLREHEEYKNQEQIKALLIREYAKETNKLRDKLVTSLNERITYIERTVPTAGQLADATASLRDRIVRLEQAQNPVVRFEQLDDLMTKSIKK
jgi:hypothetical protein